MRVPSILAACAAALTLAGCIKPPPPPPPVFEARKGSVMLQVVRAESVERQYDVGQTIDHTRTTGMTSYTYKGGFNGSIEFQRESVDFANQARTTSSFVNLPAGLPNMAVRNVGTTKRYGAAAYTEAAALGRVRQAPGQVLARVSQSLYVLIPPEATAIVTWEGRRIEILETNPDLIRYRFLP